MSTYLFSLFISMHTYAPTHTHVHKGSILTTVGSSLLLWFVGLEPKISGEGNFPQSRGTSSSSKVRIPPLRYSTKISYNTMVFQSFRSFYTAVLLCPLLHTPRRLPISFVKLGFYLYLHYFIYTQSCITIFNYLFTPAPSLEGMSS